MSVEGMANSVASYVFENLNDEDAITSVSTDPLAGTACFEIHSGGRVYTVTVAEGGA